MAESVKRNLVPVGIVVYLILLSFHAGALQNRVSELEANRHSDVEKIDKLLSVTNDIRVAVARLEARSELKR